MNFLCFVGIVTQRNDDNNSVGMLRHVYRLSMPKWGHFPETMEIGVRFALLATLAAAVASEMYTTKWDNINLDEILASDRLLNNYVNCLMTRGACTADGQELRRILPDALETECSKCSEAQKTGADKVIRHLIDHKPVEWKELEAMYNPSGKYRMTYETSKLKKSDSDDE